MTSNRQRKQTASVHCVQNFIHDISVTTEHSRTNQQTNVLYLHSHVLGVSTATSRHNYTYTMAKTCSHLYCTLHTKTQHCMLPDTPHHNLTEYLVCHCNYSSILYRFWVIWCWIILWPWNVGYGSFKVIENGTIRKFEQGFQFAFHSSYIVSLLRHREIVENHIVHSPLH